MATVEETLNEARRWLGTTEQPLGSNNVPGITDWYGVRGAWCAMFVSRVFFNVGMPLPASTAKGFAWVSAGFDWFKKQGWHTFTDYRQALPGDLIAWEWGQTPGGYDHISIVETQNPFTTIGGNERDRVKREFYGAPGGIALFARPPYTVATPTPSEEDDMTSTLIADPYVSGQWWEVLGLDRRLVNTTFGTAELDILRYTITLAGGAVLDENSNVDFRRFLMNARIPKITAGAGGTIDAAAIARQVEAALGDNFAAIGPQVVDAIQSQFNR